MNKEQKKEFDSILQEYKHIKLFNLDFHKSFKGLDNRNQYCYSFSFYFKNNNKFDKDIIYVWFDDKYNILKISKNDLINFDKFIQLFINTYISFTTYEYIMNNDWILYDRKNELSNGIYIIHNGATFEMENENIKKDDIFIDYYLNPYYDDNIITKKEVNLYDLVMSRKKSRKEEMDYNDSYENDDEKIEINNPLNYKEKYDNSKLSDIIDFELFNWIFNKSKNENNENNTSVLDWYIKIHNFLKINNNIFYFNWSYNSYCINLNDDINICYKFSYYEYKADKVEKNEIKFWFDKGYVLLHIDENNLTSTEDFLKILIDKFIEIQIDGGNLDYEEVMFQKQITPDICYISFIDFYDYKIHKWNESYPEIKYDNVFIDYYINPYCKNGKKI